MRRPRELKLDLSATSAALLMVFGVVLLLCSASPAAGAEMQTYLFNATHSLTGGCAVSSLDPVADPGCPGGRHPSAPFTSPRNETVDQYGDLFVANFGRDTGGTEGAIDIFSPAGVFLTEIADPYGPRAIAVDPEGNLYVDDFATGIRGETGGNPKLELYVPSVYEPASGRIAYANQPSVLIAQGAGLPFAGGVVVDPADGHLFVQWKFEVIREYGSAEEGNPLLESFGAGVLNGGRWLGVDAAHDRLYASDTGANAEQSVVRVLELDAPHNLLFTVDGSTVPADRFFSTLGDLSITTDEKDGNFFVDDLEKARKVYEFSPDGTYLSTLSRAGAEYVQPVSGIASDNGPHSPNAGFVYVPSGDKTCCDLLAFEPPPVIVAPKVQSLTANEVSAGEATIEGSIDPGGAPAEYTFQITTQASFEESRFAGPDTLASGILPSSNEGAAVSAAASGLSPETAYRVRLSASGSGGSDEKQIVFSTFGQATSTGNCPNQQLRTGSSASLPDCRAFELVTPTNTGGHFPYDVGASVASSKIGTMTASPSGESVYFMTIGGAIPGLGGAGSFGGTPYVSTRGQDGWSTSSVGLDGEQTIAPKPGGASPDHGFVLVEATKEGPAVLEGLASVYLRSPDGSLSLVGVGSVDSEPFVEPKMVSAEGRHLIFTTQSAPGNPPIPGRQLEPEAPPTGTAAIYDRTPDGTIHVVSLLPGDVTPSEPAFYKGASANGNAVAFTLGEHEEGGLYVRIDDAQSFKVGESGATFAGLSADGRSLFFISEGELFDFDWEADRAVAVAEGSGLQVFNMAAGGGGVFFISTSVLGVGVNPRESSPVNGAQNLYSWTETTGVQFVGTVTDRDVEGELTGSGGKFIDGLGLWSSNLSAGTVAADPSRTGRDGGILVFSSRASLTGYPSEGHAELFRYDGPTDELTCVSCNRTGIPATSGASLEAVTLIQGGPVPTSSAATIPNMSPGGERIVFTSKEALVPSDTDGVEDVYEWESAGTGSCTSAAACIYLLSSGRSAKPNYLYGVSESGGDVFFSTSDLLTEADSDPTPSIYDARVDGGIIPESASPPCSGEGCRSPLSAAPILPSAASSETGSSGNMFPAVKKQCRKWTRREKVKGTYRCAKTKKKAAHRSTKKSKRHHKSTPTGKRSGR